MGRAQKITSELVSCTDVVTAADEKDEKEYIVYVEAKGLHFLLLLQLQRSDFQHF